MNENIPMVIAITLNFNQNEYTINCIKSLFESDYEHFRILLVDNGSTLFNFNSLLKQLHYLNDERLIVKRVEKNMGYVGGINYGIDVSTNLLPCYYLIMNNDTIIDKYSISALVTTCMRYENRAIVTGKVYWYDKPQVLQNTGVIFSALNKNTKPIGLNEIDHGQFNTVQERDMIDDIYWLFPISLVELIGKYCDDYWFNYEQADFAMRAKNQGFKLVFTPKAKIWHKAGLSMGGRINNPIKTYYSTQSCLIYYYKNFNTLIFTYEYLKVLRKIVKSIIFFLFLKADIKEVYAIISGILYFHKWRNKPEKNDGKIPSLLL